MKLTHRAVIELVAAHSALDGSKDNSYKFASKVRYSLSKNLRLLQTRAADIDKERTKIVEDVSPNGPIKPETPEMKEFQNRYFAFLQEEDDIPNLMQLKLEDLNLDSNQIPITVLAALGHILVE